MEPVKFSNSPFDWALVVSNMRSCSPASAREGIGTLLVFVGGSVVAAAPRSGSRSTAHTGVVSVVLGSGVVGGWKGRGGSGGKL